MFQRQRVNLWELLFIAGKEQELHEDDTLALKHVERQTKKQFNKLSLSVHFFVHCT
jgi:hypothetical protein